MLDARFVVVGAALQILGSARYVTMTLRGRAVPHRLTWMLWAVAPLIAFGAEVSQGVGIRSLLTLLVGLSPLAVLAASFVAHQHGRWTLTRFDLACGALSVAGLVLWQVSGHGDVAIAMSLAGDGFAGIPTFRKAYLAPETESYATYLASAISAVITLLTVRDWTFAEVGWPIYIAAVGTVLVLLVRFRPGAPARVSVASTE